MRHTITFTDETKKTFVPNHRKGDQYIATIQNLTGEIITITVTNQDVQDTLSISFQNPVGGGVLTINDNEFQFISLPYDGWLITAASSATGTVEIVEAG